MTGVRLAPDTEFVVLGFVHGEPEVISDLERMTGAHGEVVNSLIHERLHKMPRSLCGDHCGVCGRCRILRRECPQ